MRACSVCGFESGGEVLLEGLTSIYALGKTYSIIMCPSCKISWTRPQPTESELSNSYASNYAFEVHRWVSREKFIRARGLIRAAGIFSSNLKVLEIGTGGGELASEVAKFVSYVHGCEIDTKSVDRANSFSGVTVKRADVRDFLGELPKNSYDVAIFSHTLEHFIDPLTILKNTSDCLTETAKVLIVVPNRQASPKFFKKKWGYWQVPIHITHHSPESIMHLCDKAGLKVDRICFRRSDFMALGSYILNICNKKPAPVAPHSKVLGVLISTISTLYGFTYRLGSQDMIVVASKK